ncbi:hypothetical protein Tco_0724012, partial [Tanacetum coccineum]
EKVDEVKEEEQVKRIGKRKKQKARKGINVDKSAQEDSETDKEELVEALNPTPLTTKSDGVKYGINRPEDVYDRVLWSDLRTMFDPPLNEDAISSLPLQQNMYCTKALATPGQTATSKEISNPLIADSLLKTIRFSKRQSDNSNGDNACTSNPQEPSSKRFPNSTSFLGRLSKFVYGTIRFWNDHISAILGYGDLQWGNILITRVYFVEGLGHNLFSVGQFCDSDLENDCEDLGKLGAKGDIRFFIGYSANSCAFRVYNRRTKKIIETMNVTFDELLAMDFEQHSSKSSPELISMYDDYIGGQPSVATRTSLDAQARQVLQTLTATTTTADTTPTPTNSSSQAADIPKSSHDVDELEPQPQHAQQQDDQAPL